MVPEPWLCLRFFRLRAIDAQALVRYLIPPFKAWKRAACSVASYNMTATAVRGCSAKRVRPHKHQVISTSQDQGSQPNLLQSLLEQCPPIWQALQQLPIKSILALAGTSSTVRKHVCGHTTNLRVASVSDSSRETATLCSLARPFHSWSSLHRLYCYKPSPAVLSCLAQIDLPSLHELHLSGLVRCTGVAAALVSARNPNLKCLRLDWNTLMTDDLYELAKGQWPLLSELDISRASRPPVNTISDPFADSNWPLLERLDACLWTCIHLFTHQHCRWPKLKALQASHVDSLPGYVYTSLEEIVIETESPQPLANVLDMKLPSLQELEIAVNGLHGDGNMAEIVDAGKWPDLVTLKVPGHKLGLCPMAAIQSADWQQLHELELSYNQLDAGSISALSPCTWPDLRRLKLKANDLAADAIFELVRGHWPALKELELHENDLDNDAMQWLVQGAWPCLVRLNLRDDKIGRSGLQSLMLGQWPNLDDLGLWNNKLFIAIDRVIDMDANLSMDVHQFRMFG